MAYLTQIKAHNNLYIRQCTLRQGKKVQQMTTTTSYLLSRDEEVQKGNYQAIRNAMDSDFHPMEFDV